MIPYGAQASHSGKIYDRERANLATYSVGDEIEATPTLSGNIFATTVPPSPCIPLGYIGDTMTTGPCLGCA